MATTYRIHPAIGIARVGNSPGDFFVGSERVGERPDPVGGFKDGACRVKRQAARFRIFAHHDGGTVEEITADAAAITWTVEVANAKAAFPGRTRPSLRDRGHSPHRTRSRCWTAAASSSRGRPPSMSRSGRSGPTTRGA